EPEATMAPPSFTNSCAKATTPVMGPAHLATAASSAFRQGRGADSTRSESTTTPSRLSSRTTVDRNEARWRRDSTSSTGSSSGFTILIGTPGTPAPDPISTRLRNPWGITRRNKRLSRRRRSTIQSGSDDPKSRRVLLHLVNKFRYFLNCWASASVRLRPRISAAPLRRRSTAASESRAASLRSRGVLRLVRPAARPRPVHIPLLQDLKDVRHGPVQNQARGKIEEHEGEDERHHQHHLRLPWIPHRRRHLLLQKH